ncbi:GMC oxidoreductase [Ulvibacterium sp.]|uniref:GMC oxidoreductase n=1 Tax=Ulvibacterium sp. TaxID=2665914 RepID=UPI002612B9BF|nr:GMC family oxidoreductase [Ulvibacterium sp.]
MKKVIIIGSGVAGTILARELLSKGRYEIVMFEAGPGFEPGNRRIWLDHITSENNIYDPFIDEEGYEVGNEHMPVIGARLFMKGGTTNHWGGLTPRFKPEDFHLKSRTGYGSDWPISYEDLAPYYTMAETLLGITGDSENNDPPRFGDRFPFAPAPFTVGDKMLMGILEDMGISYGHAALARNANRCVTTGTCDYCPMNARYNALYDISQLQKEHKDKLTLKTESPVVKLVMDSKKRTAGVDFVDLKKQEKKFEEADIVVIASGTIESAKLLLVSANTDWKNGVGNHSDHLGRHLMGHPVMFAAGVKKGNPDMFYPELGFTSLLSRHFDSPRYQPTGKMWFAPRIGANLPVERGILSNTSRIDIEKTLKGGMAISAGGEMESFEDPVNRVQLGSGKNKLGLPTTKLDFIVPEVNIKARQGHVETFKDLLKQAGVEEDSIESETMDPDGAHASGTCRMSKSDTDGVVDINLQVHGTDNLYVCSNAVFPSIAAANPTLTVSALAVRLAEHILGETTKGGA